jgi:hypothetical protein
MLTKGEGNMNASKLKYFAAIFVLFGLGSVAGFGQTMNVKIIQRQNSQSGYSYVVPGYYNSTSNASVNCYAGSTNLSCTGKTTTSGNNTPPREISYSVTGATFSLLLPDGRVAVVNCESKPPSVWSNMAAGAAIGAGTPGPEPQRRSCRVPLVDNIQAEFKGNNAKLFWLVSIDGKKFDSETYKILAVLDK